MPIPSFFRLSLALMTFSFSARAGDCSHRMGAKTNNAGGVGEKRETYTGLTNGDIDPKLKRGRIPLTEMEVLDVLEKMHNAKLPISLDGVVAACDGVMGQEIEGQIEKMILSASAGKMHYADHLIARLSTMKFSGAKKGYYAALAEVTDGDFAAATEKQDTLFTRERLLAFGRDMQAQQREPKFVLLRRQMYNALFNGGNNTLNEHVSRQSDPVAIALMQKHFGDHVSGTSIILAIQSKFGEEKAYLAALQ